jgi:hypothetical protein
MVLGIVAVVSAVTFIFWWAAIPTGILGVVFGVLGSKKAKHGAPKGGQAKAGIITGAIGLVVAAIVGVIVVAFVADVANNLDSPDYQACIEQAQTFEEVNACAE